MLEIHPSCEIIPPMRPDEFEALKLDIKKNGVKIPIWLYEGKILDGRNRYAACRQLGIKCPTIELSNGDGEPLSDIVSLNVIRRHMDESQRAMVAAKLANMKVGGDRKSKDQGIKLFSDSKQVTLEAAARAMNVSRPSVEHAKKVIKEGGPGLTAAVVSGAMKVSKAARIVGKSEKGPTPRPKPQPKAKPDPVKEAALMVWYQLKRFPETGMLDHDPKDLFDKMNDNMKEEILKLAPRISGWLDKFPRRMK